MSRLQHVAGTRLGVEWSISRDPCWGAQSPPGPCRIDGRTRGAHYFFLLVARGPLGVVGGGGLGAPSRSDNACPARGVPLKNQTGATKFKNRPHPRPARRVTIVAIACLTWSSQSPIRKATHTCSNATPRMRDVS